MVQNVNATMYRPILYFASRAANRYDTLKTDRNNTHVKIKKELAYNCRTTDYRI